MRTASAVGVLLALSSITACRGSTSSNRPDGAVDSPAAIHIQDVQSDAMAPGTAVELHGVIVTAIDTFGDKVGQDIWVQEPGGGERSGVHVFRPPTSQIANLAVGAIVDITGAIKSEFKSSSDNTGRTVTEIQAPMGGMMTVTKTGTGTVPEPHIIDVVALESMSQADRDMVYEKWEGVLIKVQNVRAFGPPGTFGTGPDAFKVQLNGDLFLESNLAMLPSAIDGTTCFASITGVEDYIGGNWTIYPRSDTEIVGGGSGCPPAMGPPVATIADIQMGVVTGDVIISDVFVTGVSFTKRNFWVSSTLNAAPFQGVYIFGNATLDAGVVPGAKVTVTGTVSEFNDAGGGTGTLTEVSPSSVVVTAAPTTTVTPVTGITAATLSDDATGELYESVLVTLTDVKVTTVGNSGNFFVSTMTQNGTTFAADDDIYRFVAADANACYASITGLWSYLVFNNSWGFLPLAAGTGTGNCN